MDAEQLKALKCLVKEAVTEAMPKRAGIKHPYGLRNGTIRGFDPGEVISALQKAIRRCDETQTVQWAVELDQSGCGEYLWSRFMVILSEDIGVAWPDGPSVMRALYENWRDQKAMGNKHKPERLYVVHAAMLMARARKSRLADDAVWATYGMAKPMHPEVPDYAIDQHTRRGKRMGRGEDFWPHSFHLEQADHDPFTSVYQDHGMGDSDWFDKQWGDPKADGQEALF